jgi:FimV-like protein
VLRSFLLFLLFSSTNIFADIFLSSPQIKLNAQDQRVIELKIQNAKLSDGDILLQEYKGENPISDDDIDYTLIKSFDSYQTFTIVLSREYQEDYFSFKILIKDDFAKDIFIFLPSKIRNYYQESTNQRNYENLKTAPIKPSNQPTIERKKQEELLSIEPINIEPIIFKGSEITTAWSMAKQIKGDKENISIYQIMWSIYLGNKEAFLNENINLIRKDIDIYVPSDSEIENISYEIAKDSILKMNESFAQSLKSATKSLLVLTAPKIIEDVKESAIVEIKEETPQISFDENIDPKSLIEENTKQINLSLENESLDDLLDKNKLSNDPEQGQFEIFDLIFISLISLASGIFLALIFIQLRKIRDAKNIEYDFEEALDDDSILSSLPSGLSIENDKDQQQFDLAVTYYEMNNMEDAKSILNNLIKTSQDLDIKAASSNLLDKLNKK